MVQIFNEDLQSTPDLVHLLIGLLSKELKKTQITENKNYCLLALKELISNVRSFKTYDEILKETIKLLKTSNLKVIASAYKVIKTFLSVFPQDILNSPYFNEILNNLKAKLKEHDADRVIKNSVIKCLGSIF